MSRPTDTLRPERRWLASIRSFLSREDGPTAVEYAVMMALILVGSIAAVRVLGTNASGAFSSASAYKDKASQPTVLKGGTSVSSGTYTATFGNVGVSGAGISGSATIAYNAATGNTTVAFSNGVTMSLRFAPGQLPGTSAISWTKT